MSYIKAAPCGGVLFHRGFSSKNTLQIYFSERRDSDGTSTGTHSFYGGFAECSDFMEHGVGYSHNKLREIYRECVEEIGDAFETLVSERVFMSRVKPIGSLMVRTRDCNKIHDALFVSFYVEDDLADFLENRAKPTEEQIPAKLYEVALSLPASFETSLSIEGISNPYNGHELIPYLKLPAELNLAHQHELNAVALHFYRSLYA
tara:strand:- start:134833 stop:135444 length:612 start_codon:yes stop_codon:yes gene_type:complete